MTVDKKKLYDVLDRDYINGNANLEIIGMQFGVTRAAIAYYGKMMFPEWKELTTKKKSENMKRHCAAMKELYKWLSKYDACTVIPTE